MVSAVISGSDGMASASVGVQCYLVRMGVSICGFVAARLKRRFYFFHCLRPRTDSDFSIYSFQYNFGPMYCMLDIAKEVI